jgi:diguanylate cyclase (GGDEF)-like protein
LNGDDRAFEDAACVLLVVDAEGVIRRGNRAAALLAGRDTLVGDGVDRAFPTTAGGRVGELVASASAAGRSVERELTVVATGGDLRVVQWTAAPTAGGVVLSGADVTDHHGLTAELAHQALHDPLTGLPNRVLLREHLDHALRRLDRHRGELVVLFVDLDRFKGVNDTLGHNAGDRLLVALAERLRRALRPADTVARLAGDEFVVVCEDVENGEAVAEISERLLSAIERPFRIDGVDASVSASIGVAVANRAELDVDTLLRKADAAMYEVKDRARSSGGRVPTHPLADLHLHAEDLRRALEGGELSVAYLPHVAIEDGRLVAVEALARWRHPELGPVPPEAFLGTAQVAGLVVELGRQVRRAAGTAALGWTADAERAGRPPPRLAVNLSLPELAEPDLVAGIVDGLADVGLDRALLTIEVAEGSLVDSPAIVLPALRSLREAGIATSLDNVGRSLPAVEAVGDLAVDELKLDRPWVWSSARPWAPGHGVLAAVGRLGRGLGVRTVAEGVEIDEELAVARTAGYDVACGHWFAGAQPAEVIAQMVATDVRWSTG